MGFPSNTNLGFGAQKFTQVIKTTSEIHSRTVSNLIHGDGGCTRQFPKSPANIPFQTGDRGRTSAGGAKREGNQDSKRRGKGLGIGNLGIKLKRRKMKIDDGK